jgi:hypothetical protein
MHFPDLQRKATKLITDNASSILTAGGVVGTVATAVLTARATFKAAEIIHEREMEPWVRAVDDPKGEGVITIQEEPEDVSNLDKAKMIWPQYIPPVAVGTATVTCIVAANVISVKRAAALAAAYTISEGRFQEYKDKVTEKFGVNKERAVRDEVAQDRVEQNPPSKEVLILASGDVLCYDMLTGRYFQSTVENIKKAENRTNLALMQYDSVSLSQFYDEVGLPATNYTDEVGWNTSFGSNIEVRFSTTMSPDDQPCIAIDFSVAPRPDYSRLWD